MGLQPNDRQGCSARVTAPLTVHRAVLAQCTDLAGDGSTPGRAQGAPDA